MHYSKTQHSLLLWQWFILQVILFSKPFEAAHFVKLFLKQAGFINHGMALCRKQLWPLSNTQRFWSLLGLFGNILILFVLFAVLFVCCTKGSDNHNWNALTSVTPLLNDINPRKTLLILLFTQSWKRKCINYNMPWDVHSHINHLMIRSINGY